MFIYHRQIESLMQYRNTHPVVSLYLNIKPPQDPGAEVNSLLHNTRRRLGEKGRYDKAALGGIDRVFERIETHVRYNLRRVENTRLVAIFANNADLWEEFRLPVGLPSRLVVNSNPFVRPLSNLLNELDRFLVLVADSRHARIFSLYLGDFEEYPDLFLETEVPDRVHVNLSMTAGSGAYSAIGVRGGTGDDRLMSHVEDHIQQHMRRVTRKTFDFFKEKKFNRLIIATPGDKTRPMVKEYLHDYLKQVLVGEFSAQPENRDEDLRRLALEAAEKYEREHERAVIDKLFEKSGPRGGLGVLGVDPVLEALRMGQVHTLVLTNDFQAEGYRCPSDKIMSSYEKQCALCGGAMEPVEDLADEMIEAAMSQDARVEHVFNVNADFDKYKIGAILRFALA